MPEDYDVATGLDQKTQAIRVATFCSLMGKDCLQIFLNLNFEMQLLCSGQMAFEAHQLPSLWSAM